MVYDAEDNKTAEQITDVNAVVYSGTAQPPFSGGMTNTFRYRNFTLEVQLLFNLGHKMRRDVPDSNIEVRVGYNREAGNREPWISPLHKGYLDAWTPDNTDTNVPRWQTVWRSTDYYYPAADINIISASYIAVNDITLSYALPTGVAHRLGMSGCTVSAQVNNPFIWTKNSDGIDPRYMANMVGRSRRLKYGPEYMFRLNVQF